MDYMPFFSFGFAAGGLTYVLAQVSQYVSPGLCGAISLGSSLCIVGASVYSKQNPSYGDDYLTPFFSWMFQLSCTCITVGFAPRFLFSFLAASPYFPLGAAVTSFFLSFASFRLAFK